MLLGEKIQTCKIKFTITLRYRRLKHHDSTQLELSSLGFHDIIVIHIHSYLCQSLEHINSGKNRFLRKVTSKLRFIKADLQGIESFEKKRKRHRSSSRFSILLPSFRLQILSRDLQAKMENYSTIIIQYNNKYK